MLSACLLVNAQIINKQCLKRNHIGRKRLLLQLAESIPHTHIILTGCNKDRLIFLLQQFFQFAVGIFCGAGDKHIRAYLCMDLQHLTQQLHNSWDVLFFCLTNFHHNTTPFHRLPAGYAMPTCPRVHFLSTAAPYFLYSITNSRQVNCLLRNFMKYSRFVRSADPAASLSGMCRLAQDVLCACSNVHCHHTL